MITQCTHPEVYSHTLPTKKLIVLLHGVGANGENMISLVPYMQTHLPSYHFFSPHGVEPYDMAPAGRQWFSLQDQRPHIMRSLMERNASALLAMIQHKQVALGLTNQDTIILGFSQGTMMGLYLTLMQEEPFLAAIGFSGLLIPPLQYINNTTPICLVHGMLDKVITVDAVDDAIQYLSTYQIPHISHKLPNLDHSINSQGLTYAVHFIQTQDVTATS